MAPTSRPNEPCAGSPRSVCVTGLRGIPHVMGGIESHCEELLPRIKALAPSHRLTVLGRAPYLPQLSSDYRGIEVIGVPCPRSKHLETIVATLMAIFFAWRSGAHVIHIHAIGPGLLAPVARLLGLKVVMTHHGTDYDRAKWGRVAKAALRLGERLALSFAHRIIAVSPSLAAKLKATYPSRAADISYIPNGAPSLPDDADAALVMARMGVRAPFVLAVGRLVPEKGLHDLIAAFALANDGRQLVIAGADDHDSDYSRDLIAGAGPNVLFVGRQSRATLRRLYEGCDLFVMPSYHEGLPIAALEAGASGAPMLLSDIPANKDLDLGQENYFPTGDVAQLAERLTVDPQRFAIDRDRLRAHFCWDRAARETLSIYESTSTTSHDRVPGITRREPEIRQAV